MSCDQSFSNFAIVVFEEKDGNFISIDRKVLHTGEDVPSNLKKEFGKYFETEQEQLQYLYSEFKPFYLKHNPDYLVFEGLAFGAKGDRVFSLGGLYYHITTSLLEDGILNPKQLKKVTPTSVKKIARDCLKEEDRCEKDKNGNVIYNKNNKPRLNTMPKKFVVEALLNTDDAWLVDGYTTSSNKKETGKHDIPDAFFIGKAFIETLRLDGLQENSKKNNKKETKNTKKKIDKT